MSEGRKREKKTSYPRLEKLGWQDDEPTQMLKKGLDKLTETFDASEAEVSRASVAAVASAKRMSETAKKVAAG